MKLPRLPLRWHWIAGIAFLATLVFVTIAPASQPERTDRLRVLFLGDNGHHQPARRAFQILPYMAERGIHIRYTERLEDLNPETLSQYHVLMLYGNNPTISQSQEAAMLQFVANGGGIVPVHAGIAMFNNSDAYTNLVGGTFKSHGVGTFSTKIVQPNHPAIKGLEPFESWDETYIHQRHNPDKIVLSVSEAEGEPEPWTWVRTHGEGRVFYTAWGHDERTWSNPGFKKLLERGLRWAAGDWALHADWSPPALTYSEGLIPYYPEELGWVDTDNPFTEAQDPLSPESSMEQTFVEPGFRMELFASEPDIVNPIDFDWDERGRLWVTETIDYPNTFTTDRKGQDRIKILEDTDGDGRADKFTVFAEGLNIPTSITLANGGAIVAQVPHMLFLKDTDGDDKADEHKVLFSGWGMADTHAGPNNMRYGFDNQIWGAVGYSSFNGSVNGGDSLQFAQALFRFEPDGSSLEHMATFNNNTWGLAFSEEGLVFGSTANGNPSLFAAIPERYTSRVIEGIHRLSSIADDAYFYPVRENVRQVDWHGLYTAGSGYELYTARAFPKSYWNSVSFIGEPTGHLLGQFRHQADGGTFKALNEGSFIASRDEWFSPIQARVGPDGALWMIDWYNLIIQHNPTPEGWFRGRGNAYENPLRDKQHSRIYRIVHEDAPAYEPVNLADASPEALIEALKSDNMHWRLTAQRLLVERGTLDVLPDLVALINDEQVDEIGLNGGAIHALWTLHGLDALRGFHPRVLEAAEHALFHPSPGVQRTAVEVLPRTERTLELILQAGLLPDTSVPEGMNYTVPIRMMDAANGQSRLSALLALADMAPSSRAGKVIADFLSEPENNSDKNFIIAAAAGALQHAEGFLLHASHIAVPEDSIDAGNMGHTFTLAGRGFARSSSSGNVLAVLEALQASPFIGDAIEGMWEGWPEDASLSWNEGDHERMMAIHGALSDDAKAKLEALAEKWGH